MPRFVSDLPVPVRRPLSSVVRAAGRLTSGARIRPSFLVIGAQRCGTTSLHRTLKQHPAVLGASHKKGVHYFDVNYARGDDWYQGHFPLRSTAERVARRTGMPVVAGESSPYYMFHPLAPERIASDLPGVRVIVMLRDPVERAYSAYTHERARGFETEDLERALDLEEQRLEGETARILADPGYVSRPHQHNAYVARGRYVEQLERVERALGRDRMHVIDAAGFFTDPDRVYRETVEFLGLPPWPHVRHEVHNARPRSDMDDELRKRLSTYFEPYDERLAAWLGWTPSWRR